MVLPSNARLHRVKGKRSRKASLHAFASQKLFTQKPQAFLLPFQLRSRGGPAALRAVEKGADPLRNDDTVFIEDYLIIVPSGGNGSKTFGHVTAQRRGFFPDMESHERRVKNAPVPTVG